MKIYQVYVKYENLWKFMEIYKQKIFYDFLWTFHKCNWTERKNWKKNAPMLKLQTWQNTYMVFKGKHHMLGEIN